MPRNTEGQRNGELLYSPYYRAALHTYRYYVKTDRKHPHIAAQRLVAIRQALKYALMDQKGSHLFGKLSNEFIHITALIDECNLAEKAKWSEAR